MKYRFVDTVLTAGKLKTIKQTAETLFMTNVSYLSTGLKAGDEKKTRNLITLKLIKEF